MPSRIAGRRGHVADPPAGHRVGLREAAHQDRPLAHPGQGAERAVAVVAVGEPVVDLVAVDEQVVALGDAGQLVLDVVGQDRAGRVARVAEEEGLGPRRDRRLDGAPGSSAKSSSKRVATRRGTPPAKTIAGT